eukprot:4071372-Pleurochrysis_carterae.AAC.3
MQRLMKSQMTQMQQMKTRNKAFQEFLLHMTRKEKFANTAPSVTLDDLSRGGRGRGSELALAGDQSSRRRPMSTDPPYERS